MSRLIKFLVIWPDPTIDPPIHPTTHTHPWVEVSLQSKIFKQNWIILIQSTIFKFLVIWPDPTHQPTHPPTHQTIHPPMGGDFSTDLKSSNRIEIYWLVQVLLNFDWFRRSPLGVGGWVDLGGGGEWVSPTHVYMHVHACMSTHVCTHMTS